MKVYTLTGKSGTGKSYQALNLCREKNIESIIDDGLFIYKNRVEAGISAKRQATMTGAIKTAVFTLDEHAKSVSEKIKETKPKSLLILGTSDRMTEKIVARLGLPEISERIYIEDISSEEDRAQAARHRQQLGQHVIPVPTLQLKRDFAGFFMHPLRTIMEFNPFVKGAQEEGEKTVVRPTFSYMGEFFIAEQVIKDIVKCVARETNGVGNVIKVNENTHPDNLIAEVSINIKRGHHIWETATEFQSKLTSVIEEMTAFNVVKVNVEVRGLE